MVSFHRLYFLILFCLTALMPQIAAALSIDDMRFGVHPDKTRIVLELSEVSDYRVFMLGNPYRIVIDLPQFEPGGQFKARLSESRGVNSVSDVRWGHLNPQISRLVMDMTGPVQIDSTFLLPAKQNFPPRLVIDFKKTDTNSFRANLDSVFGTLSIEDIKAASKKGEQKKADPANNYVRPTEKPLSASILTPPAKPYTPARKPVIIIDPGHGGVDPGAIAFNGIYEKDIVLKLSHELRRQLEETGRFDVKMTRQDDRFLRLHDRVAFARRHKGDLFLSIHADSLERSSVSGASVYTLSERASDAQTAKLARRENQADLIAGVDLATEGREVANILIDLAMRDTMNQSAYFANTLVDHMQNGHINTLHNPHRFAGFAVLKAPDIPSVLIEAGFLSNHREARQLSKASYRRKVARSIVNGIMAYYDKVERNRRS